MKKEMLINVSEPEECRIAVIEDGRLEELYIERSSQDNYVGNIYKGKVVNLEPSIQAAFVDFGVGKNGFLHISDIEPQYYRQGGFDPADAQQDDAATYQTTDPGHTSSGRRSIGPSDQGRHWYQRADPLDIYQYPGALSRLDAGIGTSWCFPQD